MTNAGLAPRPAPRHGARSLGPGRPGHAGPGGARRRGGRAGRRLVRPARSVPTLVGARRRRARARRGRRPGRPAHRHGVGARRALRHGGRRVPDPGAQRVRRPRESARGCSRSALARYAVRRGRLVLPWLRRPLPPRYWRKVVAAIQGVVLDRRGGRTSCPALVDRRRCSSSRWRCSPSRSAARCGGCGARRRVEPSRRRRRSRSRRRVDASRRSADRARLLLVWFALVAPERRSAGLAPRRVPADPARGPWCWSPGRSCCPRAAGAGAGRWSPGWCSAADRRQGPRHGLLEALDRPFDPLYDWTYLGSAVGLLARLVRAAPRRSPSSSAAGVLAVGRARAGPAGGAPGLHPGRGPAPDRPSVRTVDRARRGLGAAAPSSALQHRAGRAGRLHQRRGARLRPRSRRSATASADQQEFAAAARRRPAARRARATSLLTGLRGKDVLSCSSRATAGSRSRTRRSRRASTPVLDDGTAAAARGRVLRPQRLPHLADVRRRSAGWPTPRCSPGCGSTTSSATTRCSSSDRLTLSQRLRARRLAHRRRRARPTRATGREGERSTTTTRSTTRATSATPGPPFGYADDARPVHPRRLPAPRARRRATDRR